MEKIGKICWLIDTEGWAFENRAKAISSRLPNFEHEILVMNSLETMKKLHKFDIIVCDFLPWMIDIKLNNRQRLIVGLRSFRALEIYEALANAG